MESKYPKIVKGVVKQVHSGDFVTIRRTKKGVATDHQYLLASLSAPRMGNNSRSEEPFAFHARESLRERVIGKKCEFHIEYAINEREFGTLFVEEENINVYQAASGYVKVLEKKSDKSNAAGAYNELVKAAAEKQKKNFGVYNQKPNYIARHTRDVKSSQDPDFIAEDVVKASTKAGKPFKSIVEYVFNACSLNLYVESLNLTCKVNLNHVYTPATEKKMSEKGKALTEKLLLNRVVGVTFQRVDDHGVLVGRIHHPQGDIALLLVESGFARTAKPKADEITDAAYFKELRDAFTIASI